MSQSQSRHPNASVLKKTPAQLLLEQHLKQANRVLAAQPTGDEEEDEATAAEETKLLSAGKIQELVARVDPTEKVDAVVEEMLLQLADEFIYNVATCASTLAKHRGSNTLDVADLQFHLDKHWDIRIPGFAAPEQAMPVARRSTVEAHQKRLQLVRKSIAQAGPRKKKNSGSTSASSSAAAVDPNPKAAP